MTKIRVGREIDAVHVVDSKLNIFELNEVGKFEVHVSDQTSPTLILPMARQLGATTVAVDTVIDERVLTVTDPTGFLVGDHLRIINAAADRYYFGTVLDVTGSAITLDNLFDFVYIATSEVTRSSINLAVNGSVTPVVFKLRTGSPSIPSDIDITRMIITCACLTPVDLSLFGDLPPLTRGLLFREANGHQHNIFNVKDNQDLEGLTLDLKTFAALKTNEGVDGFSCRLTFAGQDKLGVSLRVIAGGNLEMVVQDDLSGLVNLHVVLEGHITQA
jgi:hypothetical protein